MTSREPLEADAAGACGRSENESVDRVACLYEPLVSSARNRFDGCRAVLMLTDPTADPELLDRFLIQFCASGVGMTEPVDRWIRAAGVRCKEIGLADLGNALERHADHEAGHHRLMIDDTRSLVELWNDNGASRLDADALLSGPVLPGVRRYAELHEATIASDSPFGQLAIEYEIERLSLTTGVRLLTNVAAICGSGSLECLSFLSDHIALDEGHTEFNRRQLNSLLASHPDFAQALALAGTAALDTYGDFLNDCLDVAVESLSSLA